MQYWIWLRDKRGRPYVFSDAILPGFVPQETVELMVASRVQETMGICEECCATHSMAHVIEEGTGRLLCPLLFSEVFQPGWTADQVV